MIAGFGGITHIPLALHVLKGGVRTLPLFPQLQNSDQYSFYKNPFRKDQTAEKG